MKREKAYAFNGSAVRDKKHNAMWDAQVIKKCYEKLMSE